MVVLVWWDIPKFMAAGEEKTCKKQQNRLRILGQKIKADFQGPKLDPNFNSWTWICLAVWCLEKVPKILSHFFGGHGRQVSCEILRKQKSEIIFGKKHLTRKCKDQTLPIGSKESFTWIIPKTILCLVLDLQLQGLGDNQSHSVGTLGGVS